MTVERVHKDKKEKGKRKMDNSLKEKQIKIIDKGKKIAIGGVIVTTIGLTGVAPFLDRAYDTISANEYNMLLEKGVVDKVQMGNGLEVVVKLKDGSSKEMVNPLYTEGLEETKKKGVKIERESETFISKLTSSLVGMVSISLSMLFLTYLITSIKTLGNSSFLSMEDKEDKEVTTTKRFEDVAGLTKEKDELSYLVNVMKDIEGVKNKGYKLAKGILMCGEPGVGKTLLAECFAGECGVPFYSYSARDFNSPFVGVAQKKLAKAFKEAKDNVPCVLFIDEIDSIGLKRGGRTSHRENDATLTTLLECMDGIGSTEGVLVIGATNRLDSIDDALKRAGRFDKIMTVSKPSNRSDREAIIKVHLRDKVLKEGVNVSSIGKFCYGLSGAEIASVLNESVAISLREGREGIIDLKDVDKAVMKTYAKGLEGEKHDIETLRRVAIHEAGHAIMEEVVGNRLLKVSVIPYGAIGGITQIDGDGVPRVLQTKTYMENRVKVLYGGLVAEELYYGQPSTGAYNDVKEATTVLNDIFNIYGIGGSYINRIHLAEENNQISVDMNLDAIEEMAKSLKDEVEAILSSKDKRERIDNMVDKLLLEGTVYYGEV